MKAREMLLIRLLIYGTSLLVARAEKSVVIRSSLGEIKGSIMKTSLGKEIYSFRGVRYVKPPTQERRFKDPVPIDAWENVYDASKEGPACPQPNGINISEDCLTLNIYIREPDKHGLECNYKKPVIVFMHPGGFVLYSSQSFLYGPKYLIDQDVILVTMNHRIGTLGLMNTGDDRAPGNLAFKDQVMALRFVQNHIASFGGDPNLVTLAGQSSGARSIHLHLVSHISRGLFHRAILMSGSMTTPNGAQREQKDLVMKQAILLNCTTANMDEIFRCLMEKPAEAIGKTQSSFSVWYNLPVLVWYPSIEPESPRRERFLHDDLEILMKSSKIANIPLMVSVTKDDYAYRTIRLDDEAREGNDKLYRILNEEWDELAPIIFQYEKDTERSKFISRELRKFYFNNEPINLNSSENLRKLLTHALVHYPTHRALNLIAEHSSSPIYFYEFTYKGRYSYYTSKGNNSFTSGVYHADDLQYLFNIENPIYHKATGFPIFEKDDPEFLTMNRLTTMWAHFAKTGEPWQPGSELFQNVTWQKYTRDSKNYLDFGKDLVMKSDYLHGPMDFWSKLFP